MWLRPEPQSGHPCAWYFPTQSWPTASSSHTFVKTSWRFQKVSVRRTPVAPDAFKETQRHPWLGPPHSIPEHLISAHLSSHYSARWAIRKINKGSCNLFFHTQQPGFRGQHLFTALISPALSAGISDRDGEMPTVSFFLWLSVKPAGCGFWNG